MALSKLILAAANVPILFTCLYALWCYRELNKELKAFSWFVFLSGIIQFTSLTLWFYNLNNLPVLHIYVGVGFICLSWFYSVVLEEFIPVKLIQTVAILFFIFNIITTLAHKGVLAFNAIALTTESVLVVILSLSTYIFLLNEEARAAREHSIKSLRWINSGLFIYFSSSILLFYFGELIMHSFNKITSRYIWGFHSFFSTVMYVCFFVGIWKRPKN